MTVRIIQGDCREVLKTLPDESVHCVVTSPPYFGLRDYGVDGQMGLEPTPDEFIAGTASRDLDRAQPQVCRDRTPENCQRFAATCRYYYGARRMTVYVLDSQNAKPRFDRAWQDCCRLLEVGKPVKVKIEEAKSRRSLDQNAKLWACLADISRQVEWPVNGVMQRLEPEEWKDILSAGLKKTNRIAAGVEGGYVLLGTRTSRMTVSEMAELIEFIQWFGAERGVQWSSTEDE